MFERECRVARERASSPFPAHIEPMEGRPGIPAVIFRVFRSLLILPYLNVTEHSSLEEFEREVLVHPVFLLQPAM